MRLGPGACGAGARGSPGGDAGPRQAVKGSAPQNRARPASAPRCRPAHTGLLLTPGPARGGCPGPGAVLAARSPRGSASSLPPSYWARGLPGRWLGGLPPRDPAPQPGGVCRGPAWEAGKDWEASPAQPQNPARPQNASSAPAVPSGGRSRRRLQGAVSATVRGRREGAVTSRGSRDQGGRLLQRPPRHRGRCGPVLPGPGERQGQPCCQSSCGPLTPGTGCLKRRDVHKRGMLFRVFPTVKNAETLTCKADGLESWSPCPQIQVSPPTPPTHSTCPRPPHAAAALGGVPPSCSHTEATPPPPPAPVAKLSQWTRLAAGPGREAGAGGKGAADWGLAPYTSLARPSPRGGVPGVPCAPGLEPGSPASEPENTGDQGPKDTAANPARGPGEDTPADRAGEGRDPAADSAQLGQAPALRGRLSPAPAGPQFPHLCSGWCVTRTSRDALRSTRTGRASCEWPACGSGSGLGSRVRAPGARAHHGGPPAARGEPGVLPRHPPRG